VRQTDIYTIVTGRYPIKELNGEIKTFDLGDIELNDFIRKAYNLGLENLSQQQLETLYKMLGGNFRMLEFFHRAFHRNSANVGKIFKDAERFEKEAKKSTDQALMEMAENLVFKTLLEQLEDKEKDVLPALYFYTLPVTRRAFDLQKFPADFPATLLRLQDLTLAQIYLDRETGLIYYFMPPLVKSLLKHNFDLPPMMQQFHEQAGRYHFYMFKSVLRWNYNELEAAFWQFTKANNKKEADEIGDDLATFYYARSFYFDSLNICHAVFDLLGEKTPFWCGNRMGMIFLSVGQYDQALPFFESALSALEKLNDAGKDELEDKGTTLNNISQIFKARGDYDTALGYLEQSLKISQQIGDKNTEGTTLNNIGQIYDAKGDYDTALDYLEQSLKISQQIGDKNTEGTTLNNIGQIYDAKGDYDTALRYLEQSLKISQQIGDKSGEGTTLNNISQIYDAKGDYDTALRYLEQSLKISQQIGDKSGEGTTLSNMGSLNYSKGDYDTALDYLEQSLKIRQQIGDKSGEGTTLNNISQIYDAKGDYDTALGYLEQSLKIFQEGGNKSEEGTTLNNISQIFKARGDYDNALRYLEQSLKISQQIGDIAGEAVTCFNMAKIFERAGDIQSAIQLVSRTVKIDSITSNPDLQSSQAYLEALRRKLK